MLGEKMEKALNGQLNAELYSGYMYLAMSAYFRQKGLSGFAYWMKVQALEELYHAMKFFGFIGERGGRPVMDAVEKPPWEWDSPLAAFQAVLEHEKKVTGLINDLVDLAGEERDHAAANFLQWFVAEQAEEEASADEVVQKLKLAQADGPGLLMLDRELAQRAFKAPPDLEINLVMPRQ